MVKKALLFFVLSLFLSADALDDEIKSFVSSSQYQKHKKLIDSVFSNRSSYYNGSQVDSLKVISKLKREGLLKLDMEAPEDVGLKFNIDFSSFFALKALSDALNALGYNYFVIDEANNGENGFYLAVTLDTKYVPDPVLLGEEFSKRGIEVTDVGREGYRWSYTLVTKNPKIVDAYTLEKGESKSLTKIFDNYWINVSGGGSLSVKSLEGNNWYPYVVFYDKYLNILSIYQQPSRSGSENIDIPGDTEFIKIGDVYGFYNIKNGFDVTLN